MKLEDQVTNLELSKRIKELGVKQESFFYYEFITLTEDYHISWDNSSSKDNYSSFTASELLEMLPKYTYEIIVSLRWIDIACEFLEISFKADNLCNALAKMLISLIENKIIEV